MTFSSANVLPSWLHTLNMIVSTVASTLLYLSQLFGGSIVRESNDFGMPSLSPDSGYSDSYDNLADVGGHGRLSKWSADNKARFLADLEDGKAGDWIVGEAFRTPMPTASYATHSTWQPSCRHRQSR